VRVFSDLRQGTVEDGSQGRIYLQIVESQRSGDAVRQRVIATLGRLDELECLFRSKSARHSGMISATDSELKSAIPN
jgi:hypothetical protein